MASTIDEITIEYEEDGILLVKELDKEILTKGAWSTIIFKYQNWNKKTEDYTDELFSIRRYRKIRGEYMQQSKFNISNKKQAQKIIETLEKWIKD